MPRILLTDDSRTMRRAVELSLLGTHHQVSTADSWENMQTHLQADSPDLFLIDLFLPNVNGLEICSRLQAHHNFRHTPKILLMRRGENISADRLSAAGVSACIEKPFDSTTLLNTIQRALSANYTESQLFEQSIEERRRASMSPALPPAPTLDLDQALETRFKGRTPPPIPEETEENSAIEAHDSNQALEDLSTAFSDPAQKAQPHRLQVTQTSMRSLNYVNKSELSPGIPAWLSEFNDAADEEISDPAPETLQEETIEPPMDATVEEPALRAELEETSESISPSTIEPEQNMDPRDYDGLKEMARQAIEEVAWEVLPDLVAEVVRSELERATREGK